MRVPRHAEVWAVAAVAGLAAFAWVLVRGAGPVEGGRGKGTVSARVDRAPTDPDDLEHWLRRNPSSPLEWLTLGNARFEQGRVADAGAAWLKAEALYQTLADQGFPSPPRGRYSSPPNGWYNFACVRARLGKDEEAMSALEHAVDAGWGDADHALSDPDLESIRTDPRFAGLVEKMRTKPRVFNAG